jgi:hypothetical protein
MDEDQKLAMDDGQACGVTPASLLDSCEATASSTRCPLGYLANPR